MTIASQRAAPPASLRYRRKIGIVRPLRTFWDARELVRTLAERDLRARYKQAVLGAAWAVITPLAMMLVFSVFFRRVARIDTHGVPYAIFSYVGLLPWTFFSSSMSVGGQSLVTNTQLLNKVACPREVFPLSSILTASADAIVAMFVLGILCGIYGFMPRGTIVWVPLLFTIQLMFMIGLVLLVAGITVYVRDVKQILPMMLQLGLFATPVAYGIDAVPASIRSAYGILNPLAPVIDGYRRTVLYGLAPDWGLLLPGAIMSVVLCLGGYVIFKRLETGFADVA